MKGSIAILSLVALSQATLSHKAHPKLLSEISAVQSGDGTADDLIPESYEITVISPGEKELIEAYWENRVDGDACLALFNQIYNALLQIETDINNVNNDIEIYNTQCSAQCISGYVQCNGQCKPPGPCCTELGLA